MTSNTIIRLLSAALMTALARSAALTARDANEHVELVNCAGPKGYSSRMFWYDGTPYGTPGAQTVVTSGHWVTWESGDVSGTFSDGDVFTSDIQLSCPAGTFAGYGKNDYPGDFYCYRSNGNPSSGYTTSDGSSCNIIYDCNRQQPSDTVACDGIQIRWTVSSNSVELGTDTSYNLGSIFDTIGNVEEGGGWNDAAQSIGGGCSVVFSGTAWDSATVTAMSNLLTQGVAQSNSVLSTWTTTQNGACESWVGSIGGDACQQYQQVTVSHTKMPQWIQVTAWNTASQSERGSLTMEVACQSPQGDCDLVNGLIGWLVGAAGLFDPIIGVLAGGLASSIVDPVSGC